MAHDFFASLDWGALEARTLPAPFVPEIASPKDTSNFETPEAVEDSEFDEFIDATYEGLWEDEFGKALPLSEVAHLSMDPAEKAAPELALRRSTIKRSSVAMGKEGS